MMFTNFDSQRESIRIANIQQTLETEIARHRKISIPYNHLP